MKVLQCNFILFLFGRIVQPLFTIRRNRKVTTIVRRYYIFHAIVDIFRKLNIISLGLTLTTFEFLLDSALTSEHSYNRCVAILSKSRSVICITCMYLQNSYKIKLYVNNVDTTAANEKAIYCDIPAFINVLTASLLVLKM